MSKDKKVLELALSKLSAPKGVRDEFEPGLYPVDEMVHIKGILQIGEDSERAPSVSIPYLAAMGVAIHRMGTMRDVFLSKFMEVLRIYLDGDEKVREGLLAEFPEAEAMEKAIKAMMQELPKQACKGQVKFKGEVLTIEPKE